MKVRWTRGSVRLRITPTELKALERGASVREEFTLPGGGTWGAAIQPGAPETGLTLKRGELRFSLSDADRDRLLAPDAEGVYFHREDAQGVGVRYFIEKDFPCAHPRAAEAGEPAAETFAAPEGFLDRKTAAKNETAA